jgi:hypothetical protein
MLHFDDLQYYAIPSLPWNWEAPLWLRTELGIYSGRLYFEYLEYRSLLGYLSVREATGKIEEEEVDDVALHADGIKEEVDTSTTGSHLEQKEEAFARKPLDFLRAWLAICRKGQDFTHTPMGFICQGKQLLESHPFFLLNDRDRITREVQIKKAGATGGGDQEEGEGDGEFCDEDIFHDGVEEDMDDFNDAELLDDEEDEEGQ